MLAFKPTNFSTAQHVSHCLSPKEWEVWKRMGVACGSGGGGSIFIVTLVFSMISFVCFSLVYSTLLCFIWKVLYKLRLTHWLFDWLIDCTVHRIWGVEKNDKCVQHACTHLINPYLLYACSLQIVNTTANMFADRLGRFTEWSEPVWPWYFVRTTRIPCLPFFICK